MAFVAEDSIALEARSLGSESLRSGVLIISWAAVFWFFTTSTRSKERRKKGVRFYKCNQGFRQQFQMMGSQIFSSPLKKTIISLKKRKILRLAGNKYKTAINWVKSSWSSFSLCDFVNFVKNWWVPGTHFSKSMGS